jgi:hypothetical protein
MPFEILQLVLVLLLLSMCYEPIMEAPLYIRVAMQT